MNSSGTGSTNVAHKGIHELIGYYHGQWCK